MFRPKSAPPSADLADNALDTIGIVLRALADSADDDDERRLLEGWSQHVLTQTPRPGLSGSLPALPGGGRRDWPGVRSALTNLIRGRAQRAGRAVTDLREAMNAVTRSLTRAFAEDQAGDARARAELLKLKEATETKSPEEIRRCAVDAVAALSGLLDERERTWTGRLREATERANRLQGRLVVAEKEGNTDPLTALTNRRGFDLQLDQALEAAVIFGDASTLILFDLDHFKRINDAHGHDAGDAALRTFANALALCFPRHGDCVARYGGEEFAVVLRRSGIADGVRLAERCLERVRQLEVPSGDVTISLTASAGITELSANELAPQVIARADAALYAAKRDGRNRVARR
jgi:diguanylate cyclase (GGDEF)-like protein